MYREYFHIRENPFAITPDPRFLFLSRRHREAMAHLMFGMGDGGGFVLLTGEVGTGKTTLCRSLLEQVPERVDVALILNPRQTAAELLASVCDELGVAYGAGTTSIKTLVDLLNVHLLQAHADGRRTVLVIDEAQNLSTEVLEQVRLLTNLETATHKLLQIVLIGQPELHTLLAQPELRQLSQRITARYHLTPLSAPETREYVEHRLDIAGVKERLFAPRTLRLVHRLSGGVPRLINIICDRALLGAYAQRRRRVTRAIVHRAAGEVTGLGRVPTRAPLLLLAGTGALAVMLALGWGVMQLAHENQAVPVSAAVTAPEPVAPRDVAPVAANAAVEREGGEQGASPPVAGAAAGTPAAEARPGVEEPVRLETLLESKAVPTDAESAFQTLFELWELRQPEAGSLSPCDRAELVGLQCLHGRGTWTNLLHLDRPAVLDLVDRAHRRHRVVLVSLDGERLTLAFPGSRESFPVAEVEQFWFGRFTLFWSPPPLEARVLKLGSSGSDVLWLRARLDRAEGVSPGSRIDESDLFDPELHERVLTFQRTHALTPDGVVGRQTLLQLNTAVGDPTIPRLAAPKG